MLLINGQRAGEEFQRATTSPCSTARTPRLEVASSWPWRSGERRIVIKGIRLVGKPLALPGLDGRRHIAERLQKAWRRVRCQRIGSASRSALDGGSRVCGLQPLTSAQPAQDTVQGQGTRGAGQKTDLSCRKMQTLARRRRDTKAGGGETRPTRVCGL